MDPSQPNPDPLPKPESSKSEENNFEPFTFEIRPDPLSKPNPLSKPGPDKDHCSSSSSSSSSSSGEELENEDDFIRLESIISPNLIDHNDEDYDDDDFLFTVSECQSPNRDKINVNSDNNHQNNIIIDNNDNENNKNNDNNDDDNNKNEKLLPPVESPRVQIMTRSDPDEPDPNRIPASIFAQRSNISEWSITSNESLFSIKIASINNNNNNLRSPKGSPVPPAGQDFTVPVPPAGQDFTVPVPPAGRDFTVPVTPAGRNFTVPVPPAGQDFTVPVAPAGRDFAVAVLPAGPGSVISDQDSILSPLNMSERYSAISVSQRSDGSMSSLQSFAFPILSAQERAKSDQVQVQSESSFFLNGSGQTESRPEPELPSFSNAELAPSLPAQHETVTGSEIDKGNISATAITGNNNNNDNGNNNVDGNNKTGGMFSCFPCCS